MPGQKSWYPTVLGAILFCVSVLTGAGAELTSCQLPLPRTEAADGVLEK